MVGEQGRGRWWGNKEGELVGERGGGGGGGLRGEGEGETGRSGKRERGRVPRPNIQISPSPAFENFFLLSLSPLLPSLQAFLDRYYIMN